MYYDGNNKAYMNGVLIGLNVIYFLFLQLFGYLDDMVSGGAMFAPLVVERHEYYRLVTAMFMHFDIDHIISNMLMLFVIGSVMERALGHMKYLIFYVLCGVLSNIISMKYHLLTNPFTVSAGASGAVFGVVGGLLIVILLNRGRMENLSSAQLVILIVYSLYQGFMSSNVDNAAHVGGLIAGAILSLILYRRPRGPYDSMRKRRE